MELRILGSGFPKIPFRGHGYAFVRTTISEYRCAPNSNQPQTTRVSTPRSMFRIWGMVHCGVRELEMGGIQYLSVDQEHLILAYWQPSILIALGI